MGRVMTEFQRIIFCNAFVVAKVVYIAQVIPINNKTLKNAKENYTDSCGVTKYKSSNLRKCKPTLTRGDGIHKHKLQNKIPWS